jgi:hypothetical protein
MKAIKYIVSIAAAICLFALATGNALAQANQVFPTSLNGVGNTNNYPGIDFTYGTNIATNIFRGFGTNLFAANGNVTNVSTNLTAIGLGTNYCGLTIINRGRKICLSYTAGLAATPTNSPYQILTFDGTADLAHWQTNVFQWTVGPLVNATNGLTTWTTNLITTSSTYLAIAASQEWNTNTYVITNAVLTSYIDGQP